MHQALTNGLKGLARLAYLDISGMGCISDQLLEFLPRLTGLTALNLSDSPHVSGAMTEPLSLAALRPLTGVTMLGLSNTYVADDALTALSGISSAQPSRADGATCGQARGSREPCSRSPASSALTFLTAFWPQQPPRHWRP